MPPLRRRLGLGSPVVGVPVDDAERPEIKVVYSGFDLFGRRLVACACEQRCDALQFSPDPKDETEHFVCPFVVAAPGMYFQNDGRDLLYKSVHPVCLQAEQVADS